MSRKKKKAGRPPEPPAPPTPEEAAAAQAARRRELFWLILRLSIPVVGVAFLGWPQLTAALFYIFEAWLFVVVRMTTENLVEPRWRKSQGFSFVGALLRSVFGVGLLMAMFGGLSIVALSDLFFEEEWREFVAGGWQDPTFLVSVAALFAFQVADVYLFVKAWRAGRTQEQKRIHEIEKVSRIVALIACNFVVAIGHWIGLAGFVQVLAMSIVMFLIESHQGWRTVSNRARRRERRWERILERESAKREVQAE
jgi:hypothetical protein